MGVLFFVFIYALILGFPCGSATVKRSAYNAGDWIQSLGWEDFGERLLSSKYSYKFMDVICGHKESDTTDFHFPSLSVQCQAS